MDHNRKITFYERTLDTLIKYLPELTGSQLKCLLVIAYLTVKENLKKISLKIDQLEVLTGMSRKTIIKTLNELSDFCLIDVDKSSQIHSYSIRRDEIQKLSTVSNIQDEILQSVVRKQKKVEQIYFKGLDLPPGTKKIFDLWNTYIHKWLDIYEEQHLKYINHSLERLSVDNHLNGINNLIADANLDEVQFDESFLRDLFEYKEVDHE